ncbi:MAG TPA: hypothetical protein VFM56_10670, partial [Solimonas sp.]|nr:hypothetical protein [Solimonas sp.]
MKNETKPAPADTPAPSPAAAAAPDELDRLVQGAVDVDPPPLDAEPAPPEPEIPPTKVLVQMVLSPGLALLAPNWNVSRSEV